MIRFQCIHCGARIAVNDRDTSRLARCPECGGVTHPLAEHLVASNAGQTPKATGKPVKPVKSSDVRTETKTSQTKKKSSTTLSPEESPDTALCDNCGQSFGKLQKPQRWKEHWVCGRCFQTILAEHADPLLPMTNTAMGVQQELPGRRGGAALVDIPRRLVGEVFSPSGRPPGNMAFRGALIGLGLTAVVIYVIMLILNSLHELIILIAALLIAAALVYWGRKWILSLRGRLSSTHALRPTRFKNSQPNDAGNVPAIIDVDVVKRD